MGGQQADADQGEAVLAAATAAFSDALGSRLLGGYALGSLAHGGFSRLVSDVDLGLILQDPPRESDPRTIQAVVEAVRAGGSALHQRLSVFWGTPAILQGRADGGRFPPLDRLDLLEYGRLVAGQDLRGIVARPNRTDLLVGGAEFALEYLSGAPSPNGRPSRALGLMPPAADRVLHDLRTPELLASHGPIRLNKIVLFPVRFLFTAATGRVATTALAAERYLADARAPAAELVTAALAWRLAPPDDSSEVAALLGRALLPLYLHYIDDHIARLLAVGRQGLADSFQQWRARLLA
jgi:hypothetical protein